MANQSAPTTTTVKILIKLHGTEDDMPTHGAIDVAAALADQSFQSTGLGKAIGQTGWDLIEHDPRHSDASPSGGFTAEYATFERQINSLQTGLGIAARHGARLGFALACTSDAAERGWQPWLTAAQEWLAALGCDPDMHLAEYSDTVAASCSQVEPV